VNGTEDNELAADSSVAGLDWSWDQHAVCVLDEDGTVLERFDVSHDAAGLREVVRRLARRRVRGVGIERGDGPVVDALLAAGLSVFVISSRQVRALRLRYGSAGNKDDRFDAFVLADVLRTDAHRLQPLVPDTATTQALRALVRARKDLVKHRIALHNQLLAHLLAAYPAAVGLFAVLDSPISLRFLTRFPSHSRAGWLSERRLAAWLSSAGYCGRQTPAELMAHLHRAPAGVTGPAEHALSVITEQLVATLRELRARIEVLDAQIAESMTLHPDGEIFTSLPRAGVNRAGAAARRDRRLPLPLPRRDLAGRGRRRRPLDPRQRQTPPCRVPPQLRQEAARRGDRLRRRQPTGQPLGPRHLRPRPSSRQAPPARRAHPRPRLARRHLALLDRPHPLPTRAPQRTPTPARSSAGLTQGSQRAGRTPSIRARSSAASFSTPPKRRSTISWASIASRAAGHSTSPVTPAVT
jgi:transposase